MWIFIKRSPVSSRLLFLVSFFLSPRGIKIYFAVTGSKLYCVENAGRAILRLKVNFVAEITR